MSTLEASDPDRRALAADLRMLARRDFWTFVEHVFPVLHPGQGLEFADYLLWISCVLEAVEAGDERRVIFNMPPRHMKSLLISILFPAWVLGGPTGAALISNRLYPSKLKSQFNFDVAAPRHPTTVRVGRRCSAISPIHRAGKV